jgi:uncharacterized protein
MRQVYRDRIMTTSDSTIKNDKILGFFVREIRDRLGDNLRKIILFGSRARGDNFEDSDYDCLLVVDRLDRSVKDDIDEVGGTVLYEFCRLIGSIPISSQDYENNIYEPLLINVRKEGIPL